jgi:hypothetical protein
MILAGSSASICTALASSAALKVPDEGGMAGPVKIDGSRRLSSLSSTAVTMTMDNSMLFCSQSSSLHNDDPGRPGYLELQVGIAGD